MCRCIGYTLVGRKRKCTAVGYDTKEVTAFPPMLTDFIANAVLQDIAPTQCDSSHCVFPHKHTGLCSHLYVCKDKA